MDSSNKQSMPISLPVQGAGIGLREAHMEQILAEQPDLPFVEVLADNFLSIRGPHCFQLCQIAERYPVILHSVGLSLGSSLPPDPEHLRKLCCLADMLKPVAVSDHMSMSALPGHFIHDLLPIPNTQERLEHLVRNVRMVQEKFSVPVLVENISRYLDYRDNQLDETEMLSQLVERTGCGLLLDLNNLFVNASNLSVDIENYLIALPHQSVGYIHLAGFEQIDQMLVDTHGAQVASAVWALFTAYIDQFGQKPTLIEWDNNLPGLEVLLSEVERANVILNGKKEVAA
jgi:uncharacterized protein (UPF0276 family)